MTEYKEMTANRAIAKLQCEQEKNNTPSIDIAYSMAFEALKKQIPQKVQEKHIDEYICPACGEENSGCDEGKITDRYCPKCGQRLGGKNEID